MFVVLEWQSSMHADKDEWSAHLLHYQHLLPSTTACESHTLRWEHETPEDAVSVIVFVLTGFCFPQNSIKLHHPVNQVVIINLKCCHLQVSYECKGGQNVCSIWRSDTTSNIGKDSSSFCQHDTSDCSREPTVIAIWGFAFLSSPFPLCNQQLFKLTHTHTCTRLHTLLCSALPACHITPNYPQYSHK